MKILSNEVSLEKLFRIFVVVICMEVSFVVVIVMEVNFVVVIFMVVRFSRILFFARVYWEFNFLIEDN